MKLLIVLTGLFFMLVGGYYTYIFLNRKIRESRSVIGLLFYAVALFAALGILYFGGLFVIAKVYEYLMSSE